MICLRSWSPTMCGCDRDGTKAQPIQIEPPPSSAVIVGQPAPTIAVSEQVNNKSGTSSRATSNFSINGSIKKAARQKASAASLTIPGVLEDECGPFKVASKQSKDSSDVSEPTAAVTMGEGEPKKEISEKPQDVTNSAENEEISEKPPDVTNSAENEEISEKPQDVTNSAENEVRMRRSPDDAKRYLEINFDIGEIGSVLNKATLDLKEFQLKDITWSLRQIENLYKQKKEYIDTFMTSKPEIPFSTIEEFFNNYSSLKEKITITMEEFLDVLNEEDIMKQKLFDLSAKELTTKAELENLQEKYKTLLKLYEQEDALLDDYFAGLYGSEQEQLLENEMQFLLEKKQHVQITYQKWCNVYHLTSHAEIYMDEALQKWDELAKTDYELRDVCYQLATDTRNRLLSAAQNMHDAHRYLNNIMFPYCTAAEVETLSRAITHIYTDMLTPDRMAHARACYFAFHKRCVALEQWFDKVIKTVIKEDLLAAVKELRLTERELRAERVRLMVTLGANLPDEDKNLSITDSNRDAQMLKTVNIFLDYADNDDDWMKNINAEYTFPQPDAFLPTTVTEEVKACTETEVTEVQDTLSEGPVQQGHTGHEDTAGRQVLQDQAPVESSETEVRKTKSWEKKRQPKVSDFSMADIPKSHEVFPSLDKLTKEHQKLMKAMHLARQRNKKRVQMTVYEKIKARKTRAEMVKREMYEESVFDSVMSQIDSEDDKEHVTAVHEITNPKKPQKMSIKVADYLDTEEGKKKRKVVKTKQEGTEPSVDEERQETEEVRKKRRNSKTEQEINEHQERRDTEKEERRYTEEGKKKRRNSNVKQEAITETTYTDEGIDREDGKKKMRNSKGKQEGSESQTEEYALDTEEGKKKWRTSKSDQELEKAGQEIKKKMKSKPDLKEVKTKLSKVKTDD